MIRNKREKKKQFIMENHTHTHTRCVGSWNLFFCAVSPVRTHAISHRYDALYLDLFADLLLFIIIFSSFVNLLVRKVRACVGVCVCDGGQPVLVMRSAFMCVRVIVLSFVSCKL